MTEATPRFPHFLRGGDYNPDQWLDRPDILEEDVRLMKASHVNCVSIGIFSWSRLEPEEGRYDFEWLDQVIDRLWKAGIRVDLATPSGAKPAWMAQRYPEVLRYDERFQPYRFGTRHNHCLTSPLYREKTKAIDTALAQRYAKHPAVIMWHLSNEYGGDCFCPGCCEAFRQWLRRKYGTLDALNAAWWTAFWGHRYTDFSQIDPPSHQGEDSNPSMWVDWRRFESEQVRDFIIMERDAVKAAAPELPVTANFMELFWSYDYFELGREVDVISWDCYPGWGQGNDIGVACEFAMNHELMRSIKRKPFLMLESTPSQVNWQKHNKLMKPGMHRLTSLQAVAHGSDSAMIFQWRKTRGGGETFHGAAVGHDGRGDTRVFKEFTQVGLDLEAIQPLYGTETKAKVCMIFDWQNRWSLDYAELANKGELGYCDSVMLFYRPLWERGIPVDFADMTTDVDFNQYDFVIAPMIFMMHDGIEDRLKAYVAQGGTLLTTYCSGVVDEHDLAFLGDAPHGLTDTLGLRVEEIDALCPDERNHLVFQDGRSIPLREMCELPADVTAETVGVYADDFYAGKPCLTVNRAGKGRAWYLAAKPEVDGADVIISEILKDLPDLKPTLEGLPKGIIATPRGEAIFLQNYSGQAQTVVLPRPMTDLLTGENTDDTLLLPACGIAVLV